MDDFQHPGHMPGSVNHFTETRDNLKGVKIKKGKTKFSYNGKSSSKNQMRETSHAE